VPQLTGDPDLTFGPTHRDDLRRHSDQRLRPRDRAPSPRPAEQQEALGDVEDTAADDRRDPPRPGNDEDGEEDPAEKEQLRAVRASGGIEVHQLEVHHLGGIALAWPELHDPRVAAGTIHEARSDVREQLVDDIL
jgi:hypothetical protein